jgi:hypothetical protein
MDMTRKQAVRLFGTEIRSSDRLPGGTGRCLSGAGGTTRRCARFRRRYLALTQ